MQDLSLSSFVNLPEFVIGLTAGMVMVQLHLLTQSFLTGIKANPAHHFRMERTGWYCLCMLVVTAFLSELPAARTPGRACRRSLRWRSWQRPERPVRQARQPTFLQKD